MWSPNCKLRQPFGDAGVHERASGRAWRAKTCRPLHDQGVYCLWRGEQVGVVGWSRVSGGEPGSEWRRYLPPLPVSHSTPLPPATPSNLFCLWTLFRCREIERESNCRDCERHCEAPFLPKAFSSSALWSFLWSEVQLGNHSHHLLCNLLIICEHCDPLTLARDQTYHKTRVNQPYREIKWYELWFPCIHTKAALMGGKGL